MLSVVDGFTSVLDLPKLNVVGGSAVVVVVDATDAGAKKLGGAVVGTLEAPNANEGAAVDVVKELDEFDVTLATEPIVGDLNWIPAKLAEASFGAENANPPRTGVESDVAGFAAVDEVVSFAADGAGEKLMSDLLASS